MMEWGKCNAQLLAAFKRKKKKKALTPKEGAALKKTRTPHRGNKKI